MTNWVANFEIWCKQGCVCSRKKGNPIEKEQEMKTPLTLKSEDGKDSKNTKEESCGSCN